MKIFCGGRRCLRDAGLAADVCGIHGCSGSAAFSEQDARSLGPDVLYYATRLRGARNDLAKQKLGFSPRRLDWLSRKVVSA